MANDGTAFCLRLSPLPVINGIKNEMENSKGNEWIRWINCFYIIVQIEQN